MIQQQTILKAADNSGAKTVKCIKILGGYKKKYANLGDIIIISVQKLRNKAKLTSKVKKGEIYKALVIRTKRKNKKRDSSYTFLSGKAQTNSVILINKKGLPIATRVSEPFPNLLKKKRFTKFISISMGLI